MAIFAQYGMFARAPQQSGNGFASGADETFNGFRRLSLLAIGQGAGGRASSAPSITASAKEKLVRVSLRIDVLDVEISQYDQLLWEGAVRVNRMNRATYSVEGEEAPGAGCRPMNSNSNSYRITLDVMKWGGNVTDPDKYRIDSTLNRNEPAANCADKIASGARITREVVRIRRGQTIELDGSGGFHIVIQHTI